MTHRYVLFLADIVVIQAITSGLQLGSDQIHNLSRNSTKMPPFELLDAFEYQLISFSLLVSYMQY